MNSQASFLRQASLTVVVVIALAGVWFLLAGRAAPKPAEREPVKSPELTLTQAAQKAVQIETDRVTSERLEAVLKATGTVSYPADRNVKISPRLAGRIREVRYRVGDRVRKDEILAVIDSVDAATALTSSRQADNKLRIARQNLERAERLYRLGTPDVTAALANLDQARARAAFTKDALARIREQAKIGGFTQKPLQDAQNDVVSSGADMARARHDLAQAERERDRTTRLVEIGVAAKRDLEAAETAVKNARVTLDAAQERGKLTQKTLEREQKAFATNLYADQAVRSAESDNRQAELQQEAAERALRLARTAILRDLQQARSDFQSAKVDSDNSKKVLTLLGQPNADGVVNIKAPISGVLIERNVNPGQVVDQSQMTPWQMFTISNADSVWVDADVYEKDLATICAGQQVIIHVGAYQQRQFTGRVKYIAPVLDPKTRTVKVRAEIPNAERLLKDGMYAELSISTGKSGSALVLPLSALLHEGGKTYAYTRSGERFIKRELRIGREFNGKGVVESGLQEGDRVVTHGALYLANRQ